MNKKCKCGKAIAGASRERHIIETTDEARDSWRSFRPGKFMDIRHDDGTICVVDDPCYEPRENAID